MNLPKHITDFLSHLESNGFQAFVVGGCVRDHLLHINPGDWDICTSATPKEIQRVFSAYTVIPTGIKHGTLTVVSQDGQAEITTFRTEKGYGDARHPDFVTFVSDIKQDLSRRDFTVNAMAYSPKVGFVDPFGGEDDLKKGILRCVGNPDIRMREDALRILRAMRFSATYGFKIEPNTSLAINQNSDGLYKIAKERIWLELKKILESKMPGKVFFAYPEVLKIIFRENSVTKQSMEFLDLLPPYLSIRLAGLLAGITTNSDDFLTLIQDLKTDKKTKKEALSILALKDSIPPSSLSDTRRMLGEIGTETFSSFLAWNFAKAKHQPSLLQKTQRTLAYLNEIQDKNLCCTISALAVSGHDLLSAGIPPGSDIGTLLAKGLNAVINDYVPNEKKALINYLFCNL